VPYIKRILIENNQLNRLWAPLVLLLAIPLLYPALFVSFGERVLFGNHADLNYIWGVINHLLASDWAHLYDLPAFQPLPGMLASGHPLLGLFPFFWLFQLFGATLGQSHTLYVVTALYLNALGCYLVLRKLKATRPLALVLSLFPLLWGLNAVHFIWLNFHSLFWLPFCLFFLLRWHSRPGWLDGACAALSAGMLFSACEYYGIHFFLLILPPLIFLLLYSQRHRIRSWLSLLLPFIALVPVILTLYWPLLQRGQQISGVSGFDASHLIGAGDLFCYSHFLQGFFPSVVISGHSLYLGLGLVMLLFLFFSASFTRAWFIWIGLFLFYLMVTLVFFLSPLWLDILSLLLLLGLGLLSILKHKENRDLWSRFSLGVSAFFLLVLWGMPQIDPNAQASVYRLLWTYFPGFKGLRAYDRVFPLLLPFLLILAARGVQMLIDRGVKRKTVRFILTLALLLMIGEHYYLGQFEHLTPLPIRPEVFKVIPEDDRGTLLALPLYRGEFGEVQNARHMVNQHFHHLSLIGGRTTHTPQTYYSELFSLLDHGQLNENRLRHLLDHHGLSYLVIHWDWLIELYGADSPILGEIRTMPHRLAGWLLPLYENKQSSMYKVIDPEEQKVFIRSYSQGQLLGSRIVVTIHDGHLDWLEWSLAGMLPRRENVSGKRQIELNPGRLSGPEGIVLKIRCSRPVRLDIGVLR